MHSDFSLCNAGPAVLMILVTLVGVGTTLGKEMLGLAPSFLQTIPNLFKSMEQSQIIAIRRDLNMPSSRLAPDIKEEVDKIIAEVRPQLLELLEPLTDAADEFADGLRRAIKEWVAENAKIEAKDFPQLEKQVEKLGTSALVKRAMAAGTLDKMEIVQLGESTIGESVLRKIILMEEAQLKNFPRQRVYKRGFIAMEPELRHLAELVDEELGQQHIKQIKKIPTPDASMELLEVQLAVELIAEEAVLGQAKATVWPVMEEKIAAIPVRFLH